MLSFDLAVDYGDFRLRAERELPLAGIVGLFGASGCGKSTLLRALAGLDERVRGTIRFDGETWLDDARRERVPAHRRPVGFVFQDARLFRHLDVRGNLEFAAKRSPGPIGIDDVGDAFDLEPLLSRNVEALSGGERQRVSLARALLTQPRLLLLDEPLAALDARRKRNILPYLETLFPRFGIPAIFVSHATDEIARLTEQTLVMDEGSIVAAGPTVNELNAWEARPIPALSPLTILEATITDRLEQVHLTEVDCAGQTLLVPGLQSADIGTSIRLFVRAADVALAVERPSGLSVRNVLEGELAALETTGNEAFVICRIAIGDVDLRAQLTRHAVEELALQPGMRVFALVKTASFER